MCQPLPSIGPRSCRPWESSVPLWGGGEVEIVKSDHVGKPVIRYTGALLLRCRDLVAVRCRWSHDAPCDLGLYTINVGDILIEYYYPARWFNIFAIYGAEGELKGWYCNVTRPVQIVENHVTWSDLALDLVAVPDGKSLVLDEDEFAALDLSEHECRQARDALRTLLAWFAEGKPPFGS